MHAVYDLGRGGFSHLELTDGHGAEAIDRGAPVGGEIRIGDRNDATAPGLHRPDGRDFDLIAHPGTLPNDTVPPEVMVRAKVGPLDAALPLCLIPTAVDPFFMGQHSGRPV